MGLVLLPLLHRDVVAGVVPSGILILSSAETAIAAHTAYHQYQHQHQTTPSCCRCYDDDGLACGGGGGGGSGGWCGGGDRSRDGGRYVT